MPATDDDRARAELIAIAGRLLSAELDLVEPLRPLTLRCRVRDEGRTVIVKRARRLAPGEAWDRTAPSAGAFLSELAGLRFFGGLAGDLAPELLAGDPDVGVLVLADLGPYCGLDPLLLDPDAGDRARAGLCAWAEALGRMHAAAAGRRGELDAIRAALGPDHPKQFLQRVPAMVEALEALGMPVPLDELGAAVEPGPSALDTWVHRDPCPDNVVLLPDGTARIVDLEFGAFAAVGVDAAVLRMGMPTCWCAGTVPDDVLAEVEAVHRRAAAVGLPALADDRVWAESLADGGAHALAMTLLWHLAPSLAADERWGEATHRERVLTRLAAFGTDGPGWPGMRALTGRLRPVLVERWGDGGLPRYPAFR